jgi:hypothetical protein
MADVQPTPFKQRLQMAGAIVGVVATTNTLFWVGSYFYVKKHAAEVASLGDFRISFATLSLLVAAMAYGAALAPRLIGHGLAAAMGVASFVGSMFVFAKGMQPVMGVTMLGIGVLVPWLVWKSLHHSRAAWSFLVAVVAVFGAVTFFGAPKIRNLMDIGLWNALIIPGLQIVCVIALSMLRREYRD